jgi:hypothetical protein
MDDTNGSAGAVPIPAIDIADTDIPTEGPHPGHITDVTLVKKEIIRHNAQYRSEVPTDWLRIVITLDDQTRLDGSPMAVSVEVPRSGAIDSHLRNILLRLGLMNVAGGKFSPSSLVGVEVEVYVHLQRGGNKNYKFAHVDPKDLTLRGKGRPRQQAIEVPDEYKDIVITKRRAK